MRSASSSCCSFWAGKLTRFIRHRSAEIAKPAGNLSARARHGSIAPFFPHPETGFRMPQSSKPVPQSSRLDQWVDEVTRLTQPDRVVWCDGSEAENRALIDGMVRTGILLPLNKQTYPGCYLHRSHHGDVARTEHSTFICTERKDDAGPTNNWMAPQEAQAKVGELFKGCMRGRTMYVVPYLMGPVGSPYSKVGVEITDSAYVVVNMRMMTRMGKVALDRLGGSDDFVRGLHSLGD